MSYLPMLKPPYADQDWAWLHELRYDLGVEGLDEHLAYTRFQASRTFRRMALKMAAYGSGSSGYEVLHASEDPEKMVFHESAPVFQFL